MLKYFICFVILTLIELMYFRFADKWGIIDKPNLRSSHSKVVIRGGGIIFIVAVWLWSAFYGFQFPLFLAAVTMAGGVAFCDDVHFLSVRIRLVVQFVAMLLLLVQIGLIGGQPWWVVILSLIVCVGATNIYNFMDGINGITGVYSLSVLFPLLLLNGGYGIASGWNSFCFAPESLFVLSILAILIFLFFNFRSRNKAVCFGGDVGAYGCAFISLFLIGRLIVKTADVTWLSFLTVYGVDGCLTLIHRIMLHENLGQGHRKHMYQIMSNELGMDHLVVSSIYMSVQLAINLVLIYFVPNTSLAHWIYLIGVIVLLSVVYLLFMKRYYHLHEEYLASLK